MTFTLPMAIALVGSVASICFTIYRIWDASKKKPNPELQQRLAKLEMDTAVQTEQIKELKKESQLCEEHFNKLNDLIVNWLIK